MFSGRQNCQAELGIFIICSPCKSLDQGASRAAPCPASQAAARTKQWLSWSSRVCFLPALWPLYFCQRALYRERTVSTCHHGPCRVVCECACLCMPAVSIPSCCNLLIAFSCWRLALLWWLSGLGAVSRGKWVCVRRVWYLLFSALLVFEKTTVEWCGGLLGGGGAFHLYNAILLLT